MTRINVITLVLIAMLLPKHCLIAQDISIESIPYPLTLDKEIKELKQLDKDAFSLSAPAKTDLFVSPDGGFAINNSARLLFQPDSNFIITARITSELKSKWDAGLLLLYANSTSFAKFCFEKDYLGQKRVVTVVCNQTGDDCNSMPITDTSVYFRIIGSTKSNTFGFFYSDNGAEWLLIRSFKLSGIENLRIGFGSQSPNGEGCKVVFSEVLLEERKPQDWWKGF